jgi:tetratricopeptide (TPR) repeat protein
VIELLLEAERSLAVGMLDQAEQRFRQVADADPRNAMAVVGLAKVASERGDDLGAYLLARRALAIDPENDAARRLALRLEEILATRGEPVAQPMTAGEARPTPAVAAPVAVSEREPESHETSPPAADLKAPPSGRRSLLDRLRRRG